MFLIGCTALLDIFVYWRTTGALFIIIIILFIKDIGFYNRMKSISFVQCAPL